MSAKWNGGSGAFSVYLNGKEIDKVFFTADHTADEVRRSLIRHDGYDPAIVVRRGGVTRRAPAPKADRERAMRAAAYADAALEAAWGVTASLARRLKFGFDSQEYKRALADDMREAVEAAEVAADAFEETHQSRLAEKYKKRATKLRAVHLAAYERWAHTAEGNENLAYLLHRNVIAIGVEREIPIAPRWQGGLRALTRNARATLLYSPVVVGRSFRSTEGSYRYVAFDGDTPVSALQIMSQDGREGVIANVYTTPDYRRHGWATRLLDIARRRFRVLSHSTDLLSGPAGAAWASRQRS